MKVELSAVKMDLQKVVCLVVKKVVQRVAY